MNEMQTSGMEQFEMVWPQCVARAWMDEQFREALKRDPAGTLRENYQFTLPTGVELEVVDSTEQLEAKQGNTLRMIIPPTPDVDMQEIALVGARHGGARKHIFTFSITIC